MDQRNCGDEVQRNLAPHTAALQHQSILEALHEAADLVAISKDDPVRVSGDGDRRGWLELDVRHILKGCVEDPQPGVLPAHGGPICILHECDERPGELLSIGKAKGREWLEQSRACPLLVMPDRNCLAQRIPAIHRLDGSTLGLLGRHPGAARGQCLPEDPRIIGARSRLRCGGNRGDRGDRGQQWKGTSHRWKMGRYRLGIWRTISAIAVAYAFPAW